MRAAGAHPRLPPSRGAPGYRERLTIRGLQRKSSDTPEAVPAIAAGRDVATSGVIPSKHRCGVMNMQPALERVWSTGDIEHMTKRDLESLRIIVADGRHGTGVGISFGNWSERTAP